MASEFSQHAAVVLDAGATREQRVDALRALVREPDPERLRELLRQAAAAPHCADVRAIIARSYAYLGPEALTDVEPFLASRDMAVVDAATKAVVSIDPVSAVRIVTPLIRKARSRAGAAMVRVLADRCPNESRALIEQLATSARSRHRMVALVFLRRLPAQNTLPMLFEMYRREPNAKVRRLLLRVIARRVGPEQLDRVVELHRDLVTKAEELKVLIDRRGAALDASPDRDFDEMSASHELGAAETAPAAAPEAAPAAAAPVAVSAPLRVRNTLKGMLALRPASQKVPAPRTETAGTEVPSPSRGWPIGAVVGAVLLCLALIGGSSSHGTGERHAASPAPAHPLGHVGAAVNFSGDVASMEPARGVIVLVLGKGKGVAEVDVQGKDVSRYKVGDTLKVMGVIRQILAGPKVKVLAFSIGT